MLLLGECAPVVCVPKRHLIGGRCVCIYIYIYVCVCVCCVALLGEADLLMGQVSCSRTPPDAVAALSKESSSDEEWAVERVCAYVSQVRVCARTRRPTLTYLFFDAAEDGLAPERVYQR